MREEELLEHIKTVAVRSTHPDVHSWTFSGLTQAQGESVSRFVGRLKAAASLCEFNVQCQCGQQVSYSDAMVSHRLTAGLANPDHQSKILSEAKDLNSLDSKVERLVSLETTVEAQDQLRIAVLANPMRTSEYKQQRKAEGRDDGR